MTKAKQVNRPDSAEYLTVKEAAKELGIDPTAIRNYLTWGKMVGYKFKTLTLIKRQDVEEWRKRQK